MSTARAWSKVPANPVAHASRLRESLVPQGLLTAWSAAQAVAVYWRAGVSLLAGGLVWWLTGWWPLAVLVIGVSRALLLVARVGSQRRGSVADSPLSSFLSTLSFCLTPHGSRQLAAMLTRLHKAQGKFPDAAEAVGFLPANSPRRAFLYRARADLAGTVTGFVSVGGLGKSVEDLAKYADRLADTMRVREVTVTRAKPGLARVQMHYTDPLKHKLLLADMPDTQRMSTLAYGLTASGQPASIGWRTSLLLCGITDSGKSNVLWCLFADAQRKGLPIRVRASDPKGGVELSALGERVGKNQGLFQVHDYATTPRESEQLVLNAVKAMHARLASMKKRGLRQHHPTPSEPLDVLVLDELLMMRALLKDGEKGPLGELLAIGRAAGFVVWPCTQVAQVDALGRIRDLIPQRLCLATRTRHMTDAVLGDGAEAEGAKCSEIQEPGIGYAYSDSERMVTRFRAAYVSDREARVIAAGKYRGAVELDNKSRTYGSAGTGGRWSKTKLGRTRGPVGGGSGVGGDVGGGVPADAAGAAEGQAQEAGSVEA